MGNAFTDIDFEVGASLWSPMPKLKNPITHAFATLKEHGFSRTRSHFARTRGDTSVVVNLQKSRWGERYYINIGIWLTVLEPTPGSLRAEQCHIYGRLPGSRDVVLALATDQPVPEEEEEDPYAWRVRVIRGFLEHQVLPLVNECQTVQSTRSLFRTGVFNSWRVTIAAHELLEGTP
jgi:hypothetical protein